MNTKALHNISYGVYIISSKDGDKINGQIGNAVMQVTAEPPRIAISLNKDNLTHNLVQESGLFAISILNKETPMKLIGTFGFKSGSDIDKFENIDYKSGKNGVPLIIDNTIAHIECSVRDKLDCGTHDIFVGDVEATEILNDNDPMTYAYYHKVKKGKSPKNAPTYNSSDDNDEKTDTGEKYKCEVCGYIYDPKDGDQTADIEAGTSFKELPKDWVCPVCGAGKDKFKKL